MEQSIVYLQFLHTLILIIQLICPCKRTTTAFSPKHYSLNPVHKAKYKRSQKDLSTCISSSSSIIHVASFDDIALPVMNSFNNDHLVETDPYYFVDESIRDILNSNPKLQTQNDDEGIPSSLIKESVEFGFDWASIHNLVNENPECMTIESVHDEKKVEVLPIETLVMIANHCEDRLFDPRTHIGNLPLPIQGLLQLSKSENDTENSQIAVSTLISLNMLESSIRVLTNKAHGRAPLLKDMIEMVGNASSDPTEINDSEHFPKEEEMVSSFLAPMLRSLLLPNIGINLRNVLWHGFIGQIHRRWLALCIILTISINQISNNANGGDRDCVDRCIGGDEEASNSLSNIKKMREYTHLRQVLDHGYDIISCKEETAKLQSQMISSQFIPSTHRHLVNLVIESDFLKQYPVISGATMGLLIEHGLRIWWCDANRIDEKVAKPGSYYVTLDGNSQRDKHDVVLHPYLTNGFKNRLVYELGGSTMALLADLFASPPGGGPNIRASIAHGLYDHFLHEELKSLLLSDVRQDCHGGYQTSLNNVTSALIFVLRVLTVKKLQIKASHEAEDGLMSQYTPIFSYSTSMFDSIKISMNHMDTFRVQVRSDDRISNAVSNITDKNQNEVTVTLTAFDEKCMKMNLDLTTMILEEFDAFSRDTRRWNDKNAFHEIETNKIAANCGASILLLNEVAAGLKSSHDELNKAIKDCDEGNVTSSRRRKQINRIFSMIPLTLSFYNICILCALLYIQKKIPSTLDYIDVEDDALLKAVKRSRMVASTFYTTTNTDRAIKAVKEYLTGRSIRDIMHVEEKGIK